MPRSLLPLILLSLLPGILPAQEVDYVRQVKPLLKRHCFSCHGALAQKARLRVDTLAAMLKGGRKGASIVPGSPEKSLLIERVSATADGERMPPEGVLLKSEEIQLLTRWIRQGAKGPHDEKPESDPRIHWAFQTIKRPAVPLVAGGHNPIDQFIFAVQHKHDVKSTPQAPREVLLRRVYLDLIGLPPTPEETQAFLADTHSDAYERLVERLLARPQHGERWARHWMDVWRYSDWYGRRAVPDVWNSAPQIWRWRDWIVKSLNADRSYARMVQEMLAADEIAPGDEDASVATGYLVRNWYALNPNQWMRDNVEHAGKAFLSLTFQCAHCHDHKYDPISQEDYFRFRAFFEPIGLRQDRVSGEAEPGPFQKYNYSVLRKVVRLGRVSVFDEEPTAKTWMYNLGDERDRMKGKPPVEPGLPRFLVADGFKIDPVKLPLEVVQPTLEPAVIAEETRKHQQAILTAQTALKASPNDPVKRARLTTLEALQVSYQARMKADRARVEDEKAYSTFALNASITERRAQVISADEQVLLATVKLAGLLKKTSTPANRLVAEKALAKARLTHRLAQKALATRSDKYNSVGPVYPTTSTGRRKALAEWIAHRDNPLTARVAVNHLWRRHFGRPLVETVADFGRNGKAPTHPELLDWLASELIDSGWSMKHLHRLIVTSATYRQHSATTDTHSLTLDPENRWYWRFPRQRIEAEVVRDGLLRVADMLDQTMGGEPADNKIDETAFRRRSLYFSVFPEDGGQPKFLEIFDAPDPCDCYKRTDSVIPQQALALTNSQLVQNLSTTLATQLLASLDSTLAMKEQRAGIVNAAYLRILSRKPTSQELSICVRYLEQQTELVQRTHGANLAKTRPVESLIRALMNHDDFLTIR